jgi:transcriptional regulator with XRE-family HTH domain
MAGRKLDPVDEKVAQNIRFQRLAKRMSQEELADKIGVTFQQIQKYEKAKNRITIGRLVRIASILDVPVEALLDGIQGTKRGTSTSVSEWMGDAQSVRLMEAFSRIPDAKTKTSLLGLVTQMSASSSVG